MSNAVRLFELKVLINRLRSKETEAEEHNESLGTSDRHFVSFYDQQEATRKAVTAITWTPPAKDVRELPVSWSEKGS